MATENKGEQTFIEVFSIPNIEIKHLRYELAAQSQVLVSKFANKIISYLFAVTYSDKRAMDLVHPSTGGTRGWGTAVHPRERKKQ